MAAPGGFASDASATLPRGRSGSCHRRLDRHWRRKAIGIRAPAAAPRASFPSRVPAAGAARRVGEARWSSVWGVVTVGELAPLLLAQELAYIEVPVDQEEYRRRSRYDAERSLAITDVVAAGSPRRILEIGVGYLNLILTLRRVLGDTVELSGVEHPGRRYLDDPKFQSEVVALNVDLRACDIVKDPFPFPEQSFDVVLFSEIIEHLSPAAVPEVLSRLRGLVAPDGRIVVSSPNLAAFFRIASLAFGNGHVMDTPADVAYHPGVYGHMRLYARSDIYRLAAHAGLRVADWRWLEWDRGSIDRSTARGKFLYGGQAIASRLVRRWSGAWVCALEVA